MIRDHRLKVVELKTKPSKRVIKVLTSLSQSKDFEEARTEWEYGSFIGPESLEFIPNCQLCNTPLYKENHIIVNNVTQQHLHVGSDCIKRFIRLKGTSSQGDTIRFMDIKEKERKILAELNLMYPSIIREPVVRGREFNRFRKLLMSQLEARGLINRCKTLNGIIEAHALLFTSHPGPPIQEYSKLYQVINEPNLITIAKETKKFKSYTEKNHRTWMKNRTRTTFSLTNSESYQDPQKKI